MSVRALAVIISACIGFLSLSQEIAWVRIVAFGQQGRPQAFSLVLTAFLIGIAAGAIVGRRVCVRSKDLLRSTSTILVIAALFDFFALFAAATLGPTLGSPRRLIVLMTVVAAGAGIKGILFPIAHHLGAVENEQRVGRSVSHVYLCNVMGATLGPIVTGFFLLDHLTVEVVFAMIGAATAALAIGPLLVGGSRAPRAWTAASILVVVGIAMIARPPAVIAGIAVHSVEGMSVRTIEQNKHGIIHVLNEEQPGYGDMTLGGNAYDGRISADLSSNLNHLDRAYFMTTLHAQPKRALVIGLSTGAWTALIRGMPGIEHVDVVEINPGYLDLIARYAVVAPLLHDENIAIHIDDGRRWLRLHPEEKYDLIFQNTTWHWRAYSSLLLSQEYFRELQSHLNLGGIAAINSTRSADVYVTAQSVFPNVARYLNFAYMSDRPLVKRADAEAVLRACTLWGRPVFADDQFAAGGLGAGLAHDPIETGAQYLATTHLFEPPRVISDLNMLPEYRHGAAPPFDWLVPLLPHAPPN